MNGKSKKIREFNTEKYELVPPEGGWGYMVCIGLSLIFIAGTGHQPVFGMIYNDFLNDVGAGTSAVTVVHGMFQVMVAIGGFSANIALKRLSLRQVGLIGAVIYTGASFFAILVNSTIQLIIINGFFQGLGLITMVYPLFIKLSLTEYGFRGTLAILCAISAHSIFGALVLHPVDLYMVKQLKSCEKIILIPPTPAVNPEKHFDFVSNKNGNTLQVEGTRSVEDFKTDYEGPRKGSELLIVPKHTEFRRLSTPVVLIRDRESLNNKFSSNDDVYVENIYKAASVSSLGNFAVEPMPIIKNKEGKWQTVMEFLDLSLLKDPIYDNIAFGMSLAFFADLTFFTLEPLFLGRNDLSKAEIANIISLGGATDMGARLLLGLSGHFFHMNSRYMYFTGSILAAIFRTVFIQYNTFLPLLVLTAFLGALRSFLHIFQPIVMAEHVPIERYPSAYGLYMLLTGIVSLTVGPLIVPGAGCRRPNVRAADKLRIVFSSHPASGRMRDGDVEVAEERKRGKMSGPPNPWGYAVCAGTVVTFIAAVGHVNSFGLIYNDFMTDTRSTANSLTTAHGVFAIMLAVGARYVTSLRDRETNNAELRSRPAAVASSRSSRCSSGVLWEFSYLYTPLVTRSIILNIINRNRGLRCGGLIGAFLFVLGSFLTILITNTNQLPFTFGILQGIGFGMMVPVCYATINYYYVGKRTTVMSVCKALQSVMQMAYPQAIKGIMNLYGFRGTLLIISGISLNTIPGTLVMITNWKHRKRIASIFFLVINAYSNLL
ncbi:hypothetical protein EVAR_45615_1 [Eumeta japonica]|uniref:Monocarboxylate transporter 9 n=1 Tax=Eumeta variegata TaxID=151549 RepID=A0A4C1WEJ9_EUMVA|nr:hypothetical protein EVAR_45615_1 [Eumeta japonica]